VAIFSIWTASNGSIATVEYKNPSIAESSEIYYLGKN